MANPLFIPVQFAINGLKNTIQKVLQPTQDLNDASWDKGWGNITFIPKEDGGLPPKGQDFNGILYTLSDHAVHRQNGQQIVFSSDVVSNYGGYAQNSIIQSDDGLRHYRSLINNNTFNPNTQSIVGRWEIYAGVGSVPIATSTVAGVMKVINSLNTEDPSSALSALMGKLLQDSKLNLSAALGVGQSWQNVTGSRQNGITYFNSTTKPIQVWVSIRDTNGSGFSVSVGGVLVLNSSQDLPSGYYYPFSFIVPSGSSYRVSWAGNTNNELISWSELR